MFLYVAENRKEVNGQVVPVAVTGRWRWIALGRWWFIETEDAQPGMTPAPAAYPNGNPVTSEGCIREWYDGLPEEADPLSGFPDADVLKAAELRGLKLPKELDVG